VIDIEGFYGRLGGRIKEQRAAVGHTQQQLADALGLSRSSAVNIEKGRQHLAVHQLARIADFLGCPPADLIPALAMSEQLSEGLRSKAPDPQSLAFISAVSDDGQAK
jgi:transcriptional regulator with XRE-family HTH domain